jgi:excisionase family DNA binding protein
MTNTNDDLIIRELRCDYKIKWLEKIIKDFIKEAFNEHGNDLKRAEELKSPFLTIGDVAKRFKVTKATVHNWINRGIITGMKVGKNRYFTEEEVKKALTKYGFNRNDRLN